MTWQVVIIAQVIVGAFMTIFTRKLALTDRKLFFVIGSLSYAMIALVGFVLSLLLGGGLPETPSGEAWKYLVAEGLLIPIGWLLQYRVISLLGASNAVLTLVLNYLGAAMMGFCFLDEELSAGLFAGAALIIASIFIAFRVQPDTKHRDSAALLTKILLVVSMAIFFSFGTFAEKRAIDLIGVWNYACFGWAMQFVGALGLMSLYGRKELQHVTRAGVRKGLMLGFITSIAGGLFIYALSLGTLSHTVVAASGKIAMTMVLAAIFLHERNALKLRLLAFVLAASGLILLVSF